MTTAAPSQRKPALRVRVNVRTKTTAIASSVAMVSTIETKAIADISKIYYTRIVAMTD